MRGPYDDIIDLPHPMSQKHPRMSMHDRAAQFSPFAALTGHGAAIAETERETAAWTDLEEDEREHLNRQLCILRDRLEERPEVAITYFVPDSRKAGGRLRDHPRCRAEDGPDGAGHSNGGPVPGPHRSDAKY